MAGGQVEAGGLGVGGVRGRAGGQGGRGLDLRMEL